MLYAMKALILFGHGARDSRWRDPFDRLVQLWRSQHPNTLVEVAFLELMEPNLEGAVANLAKAGAADVVVVPVFFGQGGHLRNDFPELLESCQEKFPNINLSATPAVGEDLAVLQAIIDFGARSLI
jgi:sirohydrochlorin cobaltochelatase